MQKDIDNVVITWNSHRIRPSRNQRVPSGRPIVLYTLPHLENTHDYMQPLDADVLDVLSDNCNTFSPLVCDEHVFKLCDLYMAENGWHHATDHVSASDLYMKLRNALRSDL